MTATRPYVVLVLAFWIAAALQMAAAPRLAIAGAPPDLLMVLAFSCAVLFPPTVGAILGFTAGLLHGGVVGSDVAMFTISRTLVAYLAGYVSRLELEVRPWYVGLVVLGGTILVHLLVMIPAPPPETWPYLRDTIVAAMYNGVLAIPLYAFLRRTLRPKVN
jgi:rod shape-determining protein MreD